MNKTMLVFGVGALALAAGCRTDKQILHDHDMNIRAGAYDVAVVEVTEKAEKEDNSQQMWRLLSANAYYMADDKVGAVGQFDKAEQVFAKNDSKSVFAAAGEGSFAMLTNDKAFAYDGGGLDREFTCIYRGIDFMTSKQPDLARVEYNRLTQYQTNWLYDREKEIASAQERLEKDVNSYDKENKNKSTGRGEAVDKALADASFMGQIKSQCGYDPAFSGDLSQLAANDYINIYGLHLTGLFRWLNGDSDRNDLRDAAIYAPNHASVRRDAEDIRAGVLPRNQVWVYVEDGLCPKREEWKLSLPLMYVPGIGRYAPYVGMALPYLVYRDVGISHWSINAGGPVSTQMEKLEDVDRLVKVEYDVYLRGALKREITRTVVKAGTEIALGVIADNVADTKTRIALKASQYAVAAWAMASVGADIRSWTTLPKSVYMQRLDRPADGKVKILGNGAVVTEVTVPEGKNTIIFVRKPSVNAAPAVKVATF